MGNLVDSILFQPPPPSRLKENKLIWLQTSRGHRIPAFHIEYNNTNKLAAPPITILYSHANAEDLGCIYPWCKYLSRQLKVNIFAYDYTGYGLATEEGKPNEANCYSDIDAAYDYLRFQLHIPPEQIVLYGRSLGSGPSCYLAAETSVARDEQTVGGLILHAPFLSVFRIVLESGCTLLGDQFPNVDYIPNVEAPTLLIHGKVDKVVPVHHSRQLYQKLQEESRTPPLFIDEMGHNNVQLVVRDMFLDHLKNYLDRYVRAPLMRKAAAAGRISRNRR
ncbi:alpha/beta-hydrolase [Chaetoceros tenuissimus]|uniref:Alpha/beta-hydrolase n=1 Tax=Chaetoceros tenuissimus TaxID=426638 RepID=A0AAD3CVX3_9STRA|nr:alpha/beta-hydrolase [Chaetoceros tenuissimus]